jgi:hypothetical protein
VLIPAGPKTNGHFSNQLAALWKAPLAEFLAELQPATP